MLQSHILHGGAEVRLLTSAGVVLQAAEKQGSSGGQAVAQRGSVHEYQRLQESA
jgi:hypothetical protein